MKNPILTSILLISLLATCFVFTACTDEEDEAAIIGTWVLTKTEVSSCEETTLNKTVEAECTSLICTRLIIEKGGKSVSSITAAGVTESLESTYIILADKLTITTETSQGSIPIVYTFVVSDDMLMLTTPAIPDGTLKGCKTITTYSRE